MEENRSRLAVILAGGLGTRLRGIVSDVPKALAPIAGRPFLDWLLTMLSCRGITKILLLLGYGADKIMAFVEDGNKWNLKATYSLEKEPLDKGGALRNALPYIDERTFFFMNGDTLLDMDLDEMFDFHVNKRAKVTIAARPWKDLTRVDPLKVDEESKVVSFGEKNVPPEEGGFWLVNGGFYVVDRDIVEELPLRRLSWEKEVVPQLVRRGVVYSFRSDGYFIDIGVPEDYFKAQREIPYILGS